MRKKNKKINFAVCAAFKPGAEVIRYLISQRCYPNLVFSFKNDKTCFEKNISEVCRRKRIGIVKGISINEAKFLRQLKSARIQLVILAWWPEILKKVTIRRAAANFINLHPSYLPFGRGKHAYYWSIVNNDPFGVTLHIVDHRIDAGKIIFQKMIPVSISDTGESLYNKGVAEVLELFKNKISGILQGKFKTKAVDIALGSYHNSYEIEKHSKIILEKKYKAGELIDILRARTFNNGPSAYFIQDGKKYFARISIERAVSK